MRALATAPAGDVPTPTPPTALGPGNPSWPIYGPPVGLYLALGTTVVAVAALGVVQWRARAARDRRRTSRGKRR